MHLATILAFVLLYWREETGTDWQLPLTPFWGWGILLFQPAILAVLAAGLFGRARRIFRKSPEKPEIAFHVFHRSAFVLKCFTVFGFGVAVLGTPAPDWLAFGSNHQALRSLSDVLLLLLFTVNAIVVWWVGFPIEAELRGLSQGESDADMNSADQPQTLATYLDFNIRHQLLVVAAPMLLILLASHVVRAFEGDLLARSGMAWLPDIVLGGVATGVFVIAPVLLRRIWRTHSLEPGPVRERLEALCQRIGLRCRDILVWRSGGMMINAAVMGVFGPLRYVLLSDGLLAQMTPRQVEAVFGHEAGHVRHRHMEHFLVFAFVGWLVVAGGMELFAHFFAGESSNERALALTVQGAGAVATAVFWGLGFGWVSRRFERQADLHGARCVTPEPVECRGACAVHLDGNTVRNETGRVCSTAAALFASALDRVAILNGIPSEEKSWRHSSIGSRIRFLISLAGDPSRARRFERSVRGMQAAIWITAILGAAGGTWYWTTLSHGTVAPQHTAAR